MAKFFGNLNAVLVAGLVLLTRKPQTAAPVEKPLPMKPLPKHA